MDKKTIIEIANDVKNRPNKDLLSSLELLKEEFDKTKELIINLTRHLDGVEELYDKVNGEIKKRLSK